jgi:hypothetical protein
MLRINPAHSAILVVPIACATAGLVGFVAIVATSPFSLLEPFWLAEAIASCFVASVWMIAGLLVAKDRAVIAGPILFLLGAAAAWMLARGIVHSVSPYYGLFSFAMACVAAMCAWLLRVRHSSRVTRITALALPILVLMGGFGVALWNAPLAVTRRAQLADASFVRLPVVWDGIDGGRSLFAWNQRPLQIGSGSTVRIELDVGSGFGTYRLEEVRDLSGKSAVCAAFRERSRDVIRSDVSGGNVPAFITRLPVRYPNCDSGTVWRIERGRTTPQN